ncbi:MAG: GNAT family N-acetyltransferase [Propionibacteriales bacterium]|nr:GNAT family N-acetyltransferase [Propionibacteriales bacterium]
MSSTSVAFAAPEVFTDPGQMRPWADGWRALAARTGTSYFCTPDWVLGWWETLGHDVEGRIAVWTSGDGRVDAVVPLALATHRLHRRLPIGFPVWTNLGSGIGAADHCGFPVDPARAGDVARWLAARAAEHSLLLVNLDPETGRPHVPHDAVCVARERCPRVDLTTGEIGSSKLRKQVRYNTRRLAAEGVEFRFVPPGEMDQGLLDATFELHRLRRQSMGADTSFDTSRREFHRRLLRCSRWGLGPSAVVAQKGEQIVGILYGLRWGDTYSYFQSGWRPGWGDHSLGTVLVARAAAYAREDGALVFDLLRGPEPYKYRFGAVDRFDETWLVPRGLGGRLLLAGFRARARRGSSR